MNSTWGVKLMTKQEIIIIISGPLNKMSWGSQENWICENELIIDSIGANETRYDRISIPVLYQLTFEKTRDKNERHG